MGPDSSRFSGQPHIPEYKDVSWPQASGYRAPSYLWPGGFRKLPPAGCATDSCVNGSGVNDTPPYRSLRKRNLPVIGQALFWPRNPYEAWDVSRIGFTGDLEEMSLLGVNRWAE